MPNRAEELLPIIRTVAKGLTEGEAHHVDFLKNAASSQGNTLQIAGRF